MLKLVISNQRGGVAKTTTTVALARYLADIGKRVLIIDTDPQGSVSVVLGLKAEGRSLHNFIIKNHAFKDCLVAAHERIDVLPSNRETVQTETILMGHTARELTFQSIFPAVDGAYDAVLIDVAPSISLLQTCAMLYARQLLIPVSMDPLSLQGAAASFETARMLSPLFRTDIRVIGVLPVMVDRRLQITETVLESLKDICARNQVPLLHAIRTDATVTKAARQKQFLNDYEPKSKALEDYVKACEELTGNLQRELDAELEATA
jgi:chromosome partitioning protein